MFTSSTAVYKTHYCTLPLLAPPIPAHTDDVSKERRSPQWPAGPMVYRAGVQVVPKQCELAQDVSSR